MSALWWTVWLTTNASSRSGLVLGSVVDRLLDVGSLALVTAIGVVAIPSSAAPHARRLFLVLAALGVAAAAAAADRAAEPLWRRSLPAIRPAPKAKNF